jgi:hypothetical protein
MQALSQRMHRLSYDVFDEDTFTYSPGRAKADFREIIEHCKDEIERLNVLLSPHLPPAAPTDDPIYKYWRKGACFLETEELCDTYPYNETIGYTKSLATSGLEHQLYTFVEAANVFLNEKQYLNQTNSKAFKLMEYLNKAFYDDLRILVREFNGYSEKSTVAATAVLFSLAACVFISFGIYYHIGFSQAAKRFEAANRQLIYLVFSVNLADRTKNADLNTFVESSGASIN